MLSLKDLRPSARCFGSADFFMIKRSDFLVNSLVSASLGCWFSCGCLWTAHSAGLSLPLQEKLSGPGLDAAWSERVSPGTQLALKDDGLHFNGPVHGLG